MAGQPRANILHFNNHHSTSAPAPAPATRNESFVRTKTVNNVMNRSPTPAPQKTQVILKQRTPVMTQNKKLRAIPQNKNHAQNHPPTVLKTPQMSRRFIPGSGHKNAVTPSPDTSVRHRGAGSAVAPHPHIQGNLNKQHLQNSVHSTNGSALLNQNHPSNVHPFPSHPPPQPHSKPNQGSDISTSSLNTNLSQLSSSEEESGSTFHQPTSVQDTTDKNTFDVLISQFTKDLLESGDIWDRCDKEIVEMRLKLCISENIALRLHGDYDDLLEDAESILADV